VGDRIGLVFYSCTARVSATGRFTDQSNPWRLGADTQCRMCHITLSAMDAHVGLEEITRQGLLLSAMDCSHGVG